MLRIIVVGMGPIGIGCARAIIAEADMQLVGMVDSDPVKVGRSLDELFEHPEKNDDPDAHLPRVSASIAQAVAESPTGGADIALVATSSRFDRVANTIGELLIHKISVVSSCEEMAFPRYQHAALADAIDAQARSAGCALLGTGVNPGFVMDSLAIMLSSMVRRVTAVRCVRRVDAGLRRLPLQTKVGATMKVDNFQILARAGKIGHMGLAESVAMIAAGLGRTVASGSVAVTLDPVIADQPVHSSLGLIEPGRVAGIHNVGKWSGDGLSVELDLTMAVGLPEPKDYIEIQGPVQIKMKIFGGIPGDSATVAALLNGARAVRRAGPGLHTMLDLPPMGCQGRD